MVDILIPRVPASVEYARVKSLPLRDWRNDPRLPQIVERMTRWLARSGGKQTLLPAQAVALGEIWLHGGGFFPIEPGGGKTLISALAATAYEGPNKSRPPQRSMILFPAVGDMKAKTRDELLEYAQDWNVRKQILITYEQISHEKLEPDEPSLLERYRPTLMVFDEAGALAHTNTAVWRTIRKYISVYRPVQVYMDGTPTDTSMNDYWHLIRAALGPLNAPVPDGHIEKELWCGALDVRQSRSSGRPVDPGPLVTLAPLPADVELNPDLTEQRRARIAYRVRLTQTPGVVASGGQDRPDAALSIRELRTKLPPKVEAALEKMRTTRVTPNGDKIKWSLDLWRYAQQMACGFWQWWDPQPPIEWRDARNAIDEFVMKKLEHSHRFFKPSSIVRAIDAGVYPEAVQLLADWRAIRGTFEPNPVPQWIDANALHPAAEWLTKRPTGALVWVGSRPAGERLSDLTNVPFFASKGIPTDVAHFGRTPIRKWQKSAIVSIHAIWKGFNLQKHHHQNLYLTIPAKATRWQQSLARTHRAFQQRHVSADVWLACPEHQDSWAYALARAEYVQDTLDQQQRLLYAHRAIANETTARTAEFAEILKNEEHEEEDEDNGEE